MLKSPLHAVLRGRIEEEAIARMWRGIRAHRQRRGVPTFAFGVLAVAAALAVAVLVARHANTAKPPQELSAVAPLRLLDGSPLRVATLGDSDSRATWPLSDGSSLYFEPGTLWEPLATSASQFVSSVRRGATTFEVKPGGPRRWIVEAGPVTVEVVGTRFLVHRDTERVVVTVERGAVLVRGEPVPDKVQRLGAGQSLEIRLATEEPAASGAEPAEKPEAAGPPAWFVHSRAGEFAAAYDELGATGVEREARKARSIDRLLALSDVARRSGHPANAVVPLERIVSQHPERPEAALAALTLGRLLLDQLDRPAEAARALEQALALGAPQGLREDVYRRLSEAYTRAGNTFAAARAGERYAREFPAAAGSNPSAAPGATSH